MDFGVLRSKMQSLKPIRMTRDNGEGMIEHSKEEQPLSPMARMFHEPDSNVYIIVIIGFKTQINTDVIKANLVHTLLKHPRFSSLQVVDEKNGGELKWVPTNVDLDNHVIIPMLDQNKDSPDKFVENYICSLSKTKISMSIPMWDLHLLNLKTSDAESIAVLRVHHSIGDGTSLMSLILSCTRKVSDPEALPTIPIVKKLDPRKPGGFWQYLFKFWSVYLLFWNTIVDVVMFLATAWFLKDTETYLKGPLGVGSTPRRIVHRIVSLDDVKLVKNAMGTTINDVMVGVTQAGLSQYLNRKYGKDNNDQAPAEKNNNIPKNIRVRATFFMNIRPSPGIHALADMMKKGTKAKWGNQIGFVLFPFTIAIRDNPLDYVRNAKAAMDRKKASLEATCSYLMAKFFLNFLGTKVASFPSQTTLWFSNVAGPGEEISYYGHPVAYIAPSCCGQPNVSILTKENLAILNGLLQALMIHVVSYVNKMTIILSVDDSIIPDPHQLCDDLEESLKLIKAAVIAKEQAKTHVIAQG